MSLIRVEVSRQTGLTDGPLRTGPGYLGRSDVEFPYTTVHGS